MERRHDPQRASGDRPSRCLPRGHRPGTPGFWRWRCLTPTCGASTTSCVGEADSRTHLPPLRRGCGPTSCAPFSQSRARLQANSSRPARAGPRQPTDGRATAPVPAGWRTRLTLVGHLATAAVLLVSLTLNLVAAGLLSFAQRGLAMPPLVLLPAVATDPVPVTFSWLTQGAPDRLPLTDPYHLAIDPDGNLWVADPWLNQFQIFASDGTFRRSWGTQGQTRASSPFSMSGVLMGRGVGRWPSTPPATSTCSILGTFGFRSSPRICAS